MSCTCSNKTILWCPHAVALAVYRIRFAERVRIRLPVSETILQLKTQQLQSLLLHLITKHHHDLLPSVQNLLDDLKRPESEISNAAGVPDPTAGACSDSESVWYFDDDLIRDEVRSGLEPNNTGKNISSLFNKVRLKLFVTPIFAGDSMTGPQIPTAIACSPCAHLCYTGALLQSKDFFSI